MSSLSLNLKVITGPGVGNSCVLSTEQALSFGRMESNDGVLANDAAISRKHFEISFQDGKCWIKDLNSRNGTYLNNQPVSTSELKQGDEIRVGETRLMVDLGDGIVHRTPSGAKLVAKSKIAIADNESTACFSTRKLHTGKIAKKRIVENEFAKAFLDLPGSSILINGNVSTMLTEKFPDAISINSEACLLFPNDQDSFHQILALSFGSSSKLFLNHTSARTRFATHLAEFIDKFGSCRSFLDEYQELPAELAGTLMQGIDLAICETEDPNAAAVIFDKQHANWLGNVILADSN